jgi:hypothetical protein
LITAGVRIEAFAVLDETTVDPRVGVETGISPRLTVSLAAGRYHQQPELLAIVALPESGALEPIRADHLVAGLRYEPRPDLWMSAEVYGKWYDAYPVSRQYPTLTFANHGADFEGSEILLLPLTSGGGGQALGVELFLKKRFARGVYGQVAYTLSKTEHTEVDGALRRSSFDTPHVVSAVGGYRLGDRWDLSGRVTVASGRPSTPALLPDSFDQNRLVYDVARFNMARLPVFHRIDVRLDRHFRLLGRSAALFVEVLIATNAPATIEASWNERTRARHEVKQLKVLPIVGSTSSSKQAAPQTILAALTELLAPITPFDVSGSTSRKAIIANRLLAAHHVALERRDGQGVDELAHRARGITTGDVPVPSRTPFGPHERFERICAMALMSSPCVRPDESFRPTPRLDSFLSVHLPHSPDAVAGIIGHKHGAVGQFGHAHRPPTDGGWRRDEPGQEILWRSRRTSVAKRDVNHFVARE